MIRRVGNKFTVGLRQQLWNAAQVEQFCTELAAILESEVRAGRTASFDDFDLSQNAISPEGFDEIFLHLAISEARIERFKAFGCSSMDDTVVAMLASWLAGAAKEAMPQELHLSDCAITGEGFTALAQVLEESEVLPVKEPSGKSVPIYVRLEHNYIDETLLKAKADEGIMKMWKKTDPMPQDPMIKWRLVVWEYGQFAQHKGSPPGSPQVIQRIRDGDAAAQLGPIHVAPLLQQAPPKGKAPGGHSGPILPAARNPAAGAATTGTPQSALAKRVMAPKVASQPQKDPKLVAAPKVISAPPKVTAPKTTPPKVTAPEDGPDGGRRPRPKVTTPKVVAKPPKTPRPVGPQPPASGGAKARGAQGVQEAREEAEELPSKAPKVAAVLPQQNRKEPPSAKQPHPPGRTALQQLGAGAKGPPPSQTSKAAAAAAAAAAATPDVKPHPPRFPPPSTLTARVPAREKMVAAPKSKMRAAPY